MKPGSLGPGWRSSSGAPGSWTRRDRDRHAGHGSMDPEEAAPSSSAERDVVAHGGPPVEPEPRSDGVDVARRSTPAATRPGRSWSPGGRVHDGPDPEVTRLVMTPRYAAHRARQGPVTARGRGVRPPTPIRSPASASSPIAGRPRPLPGRDDRRGPPSARHRGRAGTPAAASAGPRGRRALVIVADPEVGRDRQHRWSGFTDAAGSGRSTASSDRSPTRVGSAWLAGWAAAGRRKASTLGAAPSAPHGSVDARRRRGRACTYRRSSQRLTAARRCRPATPSHARGPASTPATTAVAPGVARRRDHRDDRRARRRPTTLGHRIVHDHVPARPRRADLAGAVRARRPRPAGASDGSMACSGRRPIAGVLTAAASIHAAPDRQRPPVLLSTRRPSPRSRASRSRPRPSTSVVDLHRCRTARSTGRPVGCASGAVSTRPAAPGLAGAASGRRRTARRCSAGARVSDPVPARRRPDAPAILPRRPGRPRGHVGPAPGRAPARRTGAIDAPPVADVGAGRPGSRSDLPTGGRSATGSPVAEHREHRPRPAAPGPGRRGCRARNSSRSALPWPRSVSRATARPSLGRPCAILPVQVDAEGGQAGGPHLARLDHDAGRARRWHRLRDGRTRTRRPRRQPTAVVAASAVGWRPGRRAARAGSASGSRRSRGSRASPAARAPGPRATRS